MFCARGPHTRTHSTHCQHGQAQRPTKTSTTRRKSIGMVTGLGEPSKSSVCVSVRARVCVLRVFRFSAAVFRIDWLGWSGFGWMTSRALRTIGLPQAGARRLCRTGPGCGWAPERDGRCVCGVSVSVCQWRCVVGMRSLHCSGCVGSGAVGGVLSNLF